MKLLLHFSRTGHPPDVGHSVPFKLLFSLYIPPLRPNNYRFPILCRLLIEKEPGFTRQTSVPRFPLRGRRVPFFPFPDFQPISGYYLEPLPRGREGCGLLGFSQLASGGAAVGSIPFYVPCGTLCVPSNVFYICQRAKIVSPDFPRYVACYVLTGCNVNGLP